MSEREAFTVLLLIAAGARLTLGISRGLRGGQLTAAMLLGSYAARVVLALALFFISALRLPILPSLQMGGGFWSLARDAEAYHRLSQQLMSSLWYGTDLPSFTYYREPDFFFLLAFLYSAIGAHPLYVPLLNASLWSCVLALMFLLGRQLGGVRAGRLALAGGAMLPSPYVWSSQILRDSLVLALLLAALYGLVAVLEEPEAAGRGRGRTVLRTVLVCVGLGASAAALARLRFYLVPLMMLALGGVSAIALITDRTKVGVRRAAMAGFLAATIAAGFAVAQFVDPLTFVQAPRPLEARLPDDPTDEQLAQYRQDAQQISRMFSLDRILKARRNFAAEGGASAIGHEAPVEGLRDLWRLAPGALAKALFAPFPWRLGGATGETGVFRWLAAVEVVALLILVPGLFTAVVRAATSGRDGARLLLTFSLVGALLLGLTVLNVGILFRLRLQILLPFLVLLGTYGDGYLRWLASSIPLARPRAPGGEPATL